MNLRAVATILALVLCSAGSAAEPRKAKLLYQRGADAESCPTEQQLKNRVAGRLGYDPFVDESSMAIIATVSAASAGGLQAIIQVELDGRRSAERTLTAPECAELSSAMELALGIAIDPLVGMPARTIIVAAPAKDAAEQAPPPPPLEPPDPAPTVHVGLGGLVAIGASPGVAPALELQARLQWRTVSLGVEGRAQLPTALALSTGRVEMFPTTGGVAGCGHLKPAMGCVVAAAGAFRVTGQGFDRPSRSINPYAAVAARGAVELPSASRFSARLQLDVGVPLIRTVVRVDGAPVWRTPDVSVSVGIFAVHHFW